MTFVEWLLLAIVYGAGKEEWHRERVAVRCYDKPRDSLKVTALVETEAQIRHYVSHRRER